MIKTPGKSIRANHLKKIVIAVIAIIVLVVGYYSGVGSNIVGEGDFYIRFIDVGQADSALIVCKGETMLIDGGNVEDSDLIYTVLVKEGINKLDYVVCTHAHEDHVGGLTGALQKRSVTTVYTPTLEYDTRAFSNFIERANDIGAQIKIPRVGETFNLGDAKVTILGPIKNYDDTNNTSIVLRVEYGNTSFIFTGDMESEAETDLINSGAKLDATLLKVGHHGSSTSTSYRFLREVMPTYAVISVGKNNDYGHPHGEVLSRLSDADATVYRTDECGDIICISDGEQLEFEFAKGNYKSTDPKGDTVETFIGNKVSSVFHRSDCESLPNENNRVYFYNEEQAKKSGYRPCGMCNP